MEVARTRPTPHSDSKVTTKKSPVNHLINRAFFRVVVMGTIEWDIYLIDLKSVFATALHELPR